MARRAVYVCTASRFGRRSGKVSPGLTRTEIGAAKGGSECRLSATGFTLMSTLTTPPATQTGPRSMTVWVDEIIPSTATATAAPATTAAAEDRLR